MKTTTKRKPRKSRRRGKRRGSLPGLDDQLGEPFINRELEAAEEAARRDDEPLPPPPPDPSRGGVPDLGTSSTEETAELVQTVYGLAASGELAAATQADDGRLPKEEAKLYARCLEKVVGDDELLTPKRALIVLLVGLGGRVFMAVKAKRAAAAAAAEATPGKEQAA